jgi:hypothetical protein
MHTREADPPRLLFTILFKRLRGARIKRTLLWAFDNAPFGSMDAASGEYRVVLTLRRWIDAMLRCRSVRVEIRGSSVRVLVNRRCPQREVLSALLWNMAVDGLLRRLYNADYQAQSYTDDEVLLQRQARKYAL